MKTPLRANRLVDPNILKITLTGNGAVGKTSLCSQLIDGTIPEKYHLTVGCDIHTKSLPDTNVNLILWDLAGQDRFKSLRENFYSGAHAALVVFDLTSRGSFFDAQSWIRELRRNAPDAPFILVGNKSDKCHEDLREITKEEAMTLAKEHNVPYMETSAKRGENVETVFKQVAKMALTSNTNRDSRFLAY